MRRGGVALALVLACCARSVDDPPPPDAGLARRPPAIPAPSLGRDDPTCAAGPVGGVCLAFAHAWGVPTAGMVQRPFGCRDAAATAGCMAFSYDPNQYSPSTWALCCRADGAPVLR